MATEWGGASMSIPPISEPYRQTVGKRAEAMAEFTKWAAGDPARVAQVVLQVAGMPQPPLRLLLGSDAFQLATAAGRARAEAEESLRALSESTDFVADRTPIPTW